MTGAVSDSAPAPAAQAPIAFALAVTLVREDGLAVGFTDQDAPLRLDGIDHTPAPIALSGGVVTFGVDDDPPQITGVLDAEALSAADLAAGLWDGARVIVRRVNPRTPEAAVVSAGRLGVIRSLGGVFEAVALGPKAALARPVGRVFARTCDADLGDARCGVSIGSPAFSGHGVVVGVGAPRTVRVRGLAAFADGWFAGGRTVLGERARRNLRASSRRRSRRAGSRACAAAGRRRSDGHGGVRQAVRHLSRQVRQRRQFPRLSRSDRSGRRDP